MVLGLSLGGCQRHPEGMESSIPSIPSVQFSLESSQAKCHEQIMGSTQDAPKLALWPISVEANHLQQSQPGTNAVLCLQENPRLTEDFVAHLETELEQSRLRETETLGALREMQDKVLDMEKVWLGKRQRS